MTDYEGEHRLPENESKPFWMSDNVYEFLKWLTAIVLPALATFYLTIGALWGLFEPEKVAATIAAVNTLLGVTLIIASKSYKNSEARFDGQLNVFQTPEKNTYQLDLGEDPETTIQRKDEFVLKINTQNGFQ